ncbi:hypothetical protein DW277_17360 [Clostridium botulinum]|nr:hypothetical protein [Clostridium botulinum]
MDQVRISCLKKINDKHSRLYKALDTSISTLHKNLNYIKNSCTMS